MRLNLQLTTTVWHAALPKGINKLVLLALCNHVNDATGLTWPSVTRLARLCGMSSRTVQTHIRALLRAGILCVRRLRTGHSTWYAVNLNGLPSAFPEGDLDSGPVDNSVDSDTFVDNSALPPAESAPPATDLGTPPPQIHVLTPAESAPITGFNFEGNIRRTAGAPALPATLVMIDGVNPKVLADFVAIRKKKKAGALDSTALETLCSQAALAGMTLEQVLIKCRDKGWARFEASWLTTQPAPHIGSITTPAAPAGPPPARPKPADPAIVAAELQRQRLIRQTPPPVIAGIQIGSTGPSWAHRIVNRHQSGERITRAVLRDACTVLRLDPSSLSCTPATAAARMH
ncbi:helix-turn-helix domain-containing protein [Polaromonas naphthalenivorans]|uniref:Helix-turn-helix domain-containing protein n=1 Tax=Polaromonas naphthalenivorans (strain CJ2) TaxID=365044 RepID=A1VSJ6_POLNA|nr:helix-turn-helix domain-containing protein [Polaromonas naphthalenivorans]ABM38624.1 hypothetical protein Pnap_3327 [Polaromonas naphthalenivorans CJ2]